MKSLGSGWANTQNLLRNVLGDPPTHPLGVLILIHTIMKHNVVITRVQNVRFDNMRNLKTGWFIQTHIMMTPPLRIGIKLEMVPDAGHHIYADQASFFNNAVNNALGDE